MIGLMVIALIMGTFYLGDIQMLLMSIGCSVLLLSAFALFVRSEIGGPTIFFFLLCVLPINIDGALFYFFTDDKYQYPEGPHFSAFFYVSVIGMTTFTGVLFGFVSGSEFFKDWSYRGILLMTIVLRSLTQLALVPLLLRWTASWGSVADGVWFMVVMFLDAVFFAWRWIPKQVMSAHLAPSGIEASTMALIAGTGNMSMMLGAC